jgi:hypothetical protein
MQQLPVATIFDHVSCRLHARLGSKGTLMQQHYVHTSGAMLIAISMTLLDTSSLVGARWATAPAKWFGPDLSDRLDHGREWRSSVIKDCFMSL